VILLDGDLQDPPELIGAFHAAWKEGSDIVYGIRAKREAAWHMQVLYKLFYRLFRHLSDVDIPLDAGGFSLIDRKAVEHILRLPERDVFLPGLRAWVGFRQSGVPYVRPERPFGRSTNSLLRNIWWAKKAILSFSQKPLHYMQGLGVFVFIVSMLLAAFYFIIYLVHPPTRAPGFTTTILLVLALGGIQILGLSILGDYLGKVLEESKGRPRFIRSRIMLGRDLVTSEPGIDQIVSTNREAARARNHG
jgi:dolichol-phosphate mannosyltransferase